VDIEGIKALIAEILAALPPGAADVEESRERLRQYPDAPQHDLEYLRLRVAPRAPDALNVAIDVYDEQGMVYVFVGDFLPIELTAPININTEPPRPAMDVIREALADATAGVVDGEQAAPPWS
jgi:hypothetical protein